MKTKIFNFLTQPYIVILTMSIAPVFGLIDRNLVFFFGLGVALIILWSSNFDWSRFGMGQKMTHKTVLRSLIIAVAIFLTFNDVIDPIIQYYIGDVDLSSLEDIKGNLVGYSILMIVMWVFAAFGEEFLFRGYYMKALAELLGNFKRSWLLSAIITSIYFGISHAYQGLAGILSVFLWSFVLSLIFIKERNNLLLLVLIHGFNDTIGLTLLYLGKDLHISEWLQYLPQR